MIQLISYFFFYYFEIIYTKLSEENLNLVEINNYNLLSQNKLLFLNIPTNKKEAQLKNVWNYVYNLAVH